MKIEKKSFFVFVAAMFLFAFLSGVLVSAQTSSDSFATAGLPSGVNYNQLEAANGKIINISSNLGYLGQQWQQILFSSPAFSWADGALHTISPVFRVVVGQGYSFSISFLITFLIWLFLFLTFNNVFKNFLFTGRYSKWISLGAAFLLAVIFAQVTVIGLISNGIVWLIFGADKPWWVRALIGVGIFLVVLLGFSFIARFGGAFAKRRQAKKDAENRMMLESGARVGEAITRGAAEQP